MKAHDRCFQWKIKTITLNYSCHHFLPGHVAQSVGHLTRKSEVPWVRYPVWLHTFVSPSADLRGAVVSYWRKYVHEILVNRLGGLSLPRKSVVRVTDRPDMTLDVTVDVKQQYNNNTPSYLEHWPSDIVLLVCIYAEGPSSVLWLILFYTDRYVAAIYANCTIFNRIF